MHGTHTVKKDTVVSSGTVSQARKARVLPNSETLFPFSLHAPQETSFEDLQWIRACTGHIVNLEFLWPLFLLFPRIYQFISLSFHWLRHWLLVSRFLPLQFMGFGPLSPFTSRLSSTSSNFHWARITCFELTATLLLSVTFPYLLGMRKREPIFVALPLPFPFVSFFSSVASLLRIISDTEDLYPFLSVRGLLLLYLSSYYLLHLLSSVLVFLPALIQTMFMPYDRDTAFRWL